MRSGKSRVRPCKPIVRSPKYKYYMFRKPLFFRTETNHSLGIKSNRKEII